MNNKILQRELVGREWVKGEAYTALGYIKPAPAAAYILSGSYQQFIYLVLFQGGGGGEIKVQLASPDQPVYSVGQYLLN